MYFDDFQLNESYDIPSVTIEKEAMMDFAFKYDPIPVHTDEAYAASTHFGALIAPGVMSFMSVWAKFLGMHVLGDELLAGKSTKIEWIKPVYAGDVLRSRAVITGLFPRNEKNGIVEVTVYAENQKGELVLTDVTEAVVKRRREPRE